MARMFLNISERTDLFGTLQGHGEYLDEDTPFSADVLCDQCQAVFGSDEPYDTLEILRIDCDDPSTTCRLCALLASHLHNDANSADPLYPFWFFARTMSRKETLEIAFSSFENMNNKIVLSVQKRSQDRKDTDASRMVHFESKLSPSTDSAQSTAQIMSWFNTCSENHETCRAALQVRSFVPTRLIEIVHHSDGNIGIRLRRKDELSKVSYATLSHCWGQQMPFKLENDNLGACLEAIPIYRISRVLQDAIKVADRLGISYIWIDSLCIIQDSRQDWSTESRQMGLVYQSGVINIAATGFAHGQDGMFVARDPSLLQPIAVRWGHEDVKGHNHEKPDGLFKNGDYYLVETSTWQKEVDGAPLCNRGWVTQERALSVRTIHFGTRQLFWECMCMNGSEVYPTGVLSETRIMSPKVFLESGRRAQEQRDEELQTVRNQVLANMQLSKEFQVLGKEPTKGYEQHGLPCGRKDSDNGLTDTKLARRIEDIQVDGESLGNRSPVSSDADDLERQLEMGSAEVNKERRSVRPSVRELGLTPQQFEGCDLSILDDLNIKGSSKFKRLLEASSIGAHRNLVSRASIRSMKFELKKWVRIVETFSDCSLTFSQDKLVAISGLAQMLHEAMGCDYLAGLWRTDLEHQLLWKVSEPSRAPIQDGTRGPSWSWASVDGSIRIPDWSEDHDKTQEEVIWLSQVNHVSVRLGNTGPFGQTRSGKLVLTGRLGVLRLLEGLLRNAANANGNLSVEIRPIHASWDTKDFEIFGGAARGVQRYSAYGIHKIASTHLHPSDVFYLPVRIMNTDRNTGFEWITLTGLLLLPTGKAKGQFRRVGQFESSIHFSVPWIYRSFVPLAEATEIMDDRFYVEKRDGGEYTIHVV